MSNIMDLGTKLCMQENRLILKKSRDSCQQCPAVHYPHKSFHLCPHLTSMAH